MAGHSHFANIKHKKDAQDRKKSKILTRVQRNIIVALKSGLPDPSVNAKLRNALIEARSANLAKDKIDAVIKKYSGNNDINSYEESRYNGYASGGIAVIVNCLSDNKNRIVGEVRSVFTKHGGVFGETGSVEFGFARNGLIVYKKKDKNFDEMLEIVIEANAKDLVEDDDSFYISTKFEDMHSVAENLIKKLGDYTSMNTTWVPLNTTEVSLDQAEKFNKFIEAMENLDDVQDVFHNANFC